MVFLSNFVYVLIIFIATIFMLTICYWYWLYYKYFISGCHKLTGPKFIPILGHALQLTPNPNTFKYVARVAEEHNGIARLIMGFYFTLMVTDYKLTEFILSSKIHTKKTFSYYFLENWFGKGLLLSDGQKWKNRRHILNPAFHIQILNQYIEVFDKVSDVLVKLFNKEVKNGSKRTELYKFIPDCALDIISESAMRLKLNVQEQPGSEYTKAIHDLTNIMMLRLFDPLKHKDVLYKWTSLYRKEKRLLKVVHGYTDSVITSTRLEMKEQTMRHKTNDNYTATKKAAFMDILMQCKVDGEPLSDKDIRNQIEEIMVTGYETSAVSICFALYAIANNPKVQEKIFEEQRNIFEDDSTRNTTQYDLQAMKYLELVIKEVLRLYPSVPFVGRTITEDFQYDGQTFKKGLIIFISIFSIHRNPIYFTDPDKFDPERFNNENFSTNDSYKYIPFSAGLRNCIGQKYATMELKTVLSKIIRNFVLSPSDKNHKLQLIHNITLNSTTGVPIKLEKRIWQ